MRRYILSFANVASILGLAFATQIPIGGRVVIGIAGIGSLIYLFFKDKRKMKSMSVFVSLMKRLKRL